MKKSHAIKRKIAFLLIIIIGALLLFMSRNQTISTALFPFSKENDTPTPTPDVPFENEWHRKWFEGEGNSIVRNQSYKAVSPPAFPDEINELGVDVPVVVYATESLMNDASSIYYYKGLADYGYNIREDLFEMPFVTLFYEDYIFTPLPFSKGGTVPIGQDAEGNLELVYIDGDYFVKLDPISDDYQSGKFYSFIENHIELLGEPQITYIDNLYEPDREAWIHYYFDKGVAVSARHIILFKPTNEIDESLIKEIGREYLRGILGCDQCERF